MCKNTTLVCFLFAFSVTSCSSLHKVDDPYLNKFTTTIEKDIVNLKNNFIEIKNLPNEKNLSKDKQNTSQINKTQKVTEKLYSISANNSPITDILYNLAKQAKTNLNFIAKLPNTKTSIFVEKQSLKQILVRLSKQANFFYKMTNNEIIIFSDKPFWKLYQINYSNILRQNDTSITTDTNLNSQDSLVVNFSKLSATSKSNFWNSLSNEIQQILSSNKTYRFTLNKDIGFLQVFAPYEIQNYITDYIKIMTKKSLKQVFISLQIFEIQLKNEFKAGIDWSILKNNLNISQNLLGANLAQAPNFVIQNSGKNDSATIKALETFGQIENISNPQLMTLHNQTAIIKVVKNEAYYTLEVEKSFGKDGSPDTTAFNTTLHTIPVGLILSITPFIDDKNKILLDLRPSMSNIVEYKKDPNPELAKADVENAVPVIQQRELNSIIKLDSSRTAVIGGLIQNKVENKTNSIPFLSKIPLIGNLFSYTSKVNYKSELVLMVTPTILE